MKHDRGHIGLKSPQLLIHYLLPLFSARNRGEVQIPLDVGHHSEMISRIIPISAHPF